MTKKDADELEKALKDWMVKGDWETFRLFKVWERSGYIVLPYAGGWLDQPNYITESFELLLSVKSLLEFRKREKKK